MRITQLLPTLTFLLFLFVFKTGDCQGLINKKYFSDQTSRQGADALDMIVHKGFRIVASHEYGKGNNTTTSLTTNAGIYVFDSTYKSQYDKNLYLLGE